MGALTVIELIFWASAVAGGVVFILRTVMMLVGFGADHDGDLDVSPDGHTDGDTDISFKLLSIQGLTAFFMMFGLVGLTLLKSQSPTFLSVFGGIVAGLFTVWVLSIIFSKMKLLQSDGTVDIKNAVGVHGSVYLNIPANGSGQVRVPVQGALKIFDAIAKDGQKIFTGEKIVVVDVADKNTLVVEKT